MWGQVPLFGDGQTNYLLGIYDVQVGDNLSDHSYSSINHSKQDPNESYHHNRKVLVEKILGDKISTTLVEFVMHVRGGHLRNKIWISNAAL